MVFNLLDLRVSMSSSLNPNPVREASSSSSDAALIEAMGEFSAEEDELASLTGLGFSEDDIETLKSNKLKTMDDVAELAVDELIDIVPMDEKKAADIIMKARESWFEE
jgi:N utilization substance protein A